MTLLVRSGVFLVMTVVTVVCCVAFSNPDISNEAGVVVYLPPKIPGYTGDKGVMGEQERKWLPQDTTYLKMVYKEEAILDEDIAGYRALNATLIVAGSDSRSLHRPQVCLTAQGWSIDKREVVRLNTKGGGLSVMNFHLSRLIRNDDGEKISQRAFYCYWWVGPHDTTHSDEKRVWKSTWNSIIRGENERWAYPSVMIMVDERMGEDGVIEARKRVLGFIEEYAPEFQKSLGAVERDDAVDLYDL